jgi:hypothetical protein
MNTVPETQPKNTKRVVIIVVIVLLVHCCCLVALVAGYFLIKNGDNIFSKSDGLVATVQSAGTEAVKILPTEAAGILPTEIATEQPVVELTPTTESGTVYVDDFSDPTSGWDTLDDSDAWVRYEEGGLLMQTHADSWVASAYDADPIKNITIETDSTSYGGAIENFYGIMCRMKDYDNYYYGAISSDGYAGIGIFQDGKGTLLGEEKGVYSDAIVQDGANLLRLSCVGDTLTLSVNGQQLISIQDQTFDTGTFGLFAEASKEEDTKVIFDNVVISDLEKE